MPRSEETLRTKKSFKDALESHKTELERRPWPGGLAKAILRGTRHTGRIYDRDALRTYGRMGPELKLRETYAPASAV